MLKVKELLEATNGKLLNGNLDDEINNYKIDSREVKSGDFYIPIVGENVDGHRFINDTVKNNCSGFFVSNIDSIDIQKIKEVNKDIIIIEVEDTKKALVDIVEACVIKGSLPSRQLKLVLAWCVIHQDELMQNWELAKDGKPLSRINPLV